jgi:hypothetical protein
MPRFGAGVTPPVDLGLQLTNKALLAAPLVSAAGLRPATEPPRLHLASTKEKRGGGLSTGATVAISVGVFAGLVGLLAATTGPARR